MPRPSRHLPAAAVLVLAAPALAAGEQPVDLFTPAVGPSAPAPAPATGEAVKARTRVGTARLAAAAFTVTLPGASPVVLRVKSAADRPGGVRSVHARSADDKVDAVLVEHDGKLTGSIAAGKRHFRVEPTGTGEADLVEIDEARIVKHGKEPVAPDAIEPTDRARARAAAAATGGDDGSTIDVLVVYDASAPAAVADIQATAQLSVDDYNARLDNSGVTNGRERLVGAVALQHTANASDWGGELSWLTSDPTVAGLRDRYKADLVQELIGTTNAGVIGIGWIGPSKNYAFSVIKAAYAGYGAAHEKGHNMGAHHNVEEDPSTQPYPYQHGYCGPGFFETMSYQESRCSSQVKYFSTPNRTYNGAPVGDAATADVARLLTETAPIVAAFEQSGTTPPPPAWIASVAVSPSVAAVGQTATAKATFTVSDAAANRRIVVKFHSPSGTDPRTCSALRNFAAGVPQTLSCAYAPTVAGSWSVWVRVLDVATGAELYRLNPAATFTAAPPPAT